MKQISLIIAVCMLNETAQAASMALGLKDVVDKVLSTSLEKEKIDLGPRKAEYGLSQVNGAFDWDWMASTGYEVNRYETLGGFSNDEDKSLTWITGVSKRFSLGQKIDLKFSRLSQNSKLSAFTRTSRPSTLFQDTLEFSFRQSLIYNSFGILDRSNLELARKDIEKSKIEREENLESLALQAVRAYWDAFLRKESLRDSLAIREKYEVLVKSLTRKSSIGSARRVDVLQARAELQSQERNVKLDSLNYLNSKEKLFFLLNESVPEEIDFLVADNIRPVPEFKSKDVESLRGMLVSEMSTDRARLEAKASRYAAFPELNLLGSAGYNGIDSEAKRAFSDMASTTHPKYFVGVEFRMALGGDKSSGERSFREALLLEAQKNRELLRRDFRESLEREERSVTANYMGALAAKASVDEWSKVIREQESEYRFGRISISELIQSYNAYLRARSTWSQSLANYHLSIYVLAATRDELIEKRGSL